MKIFLSHKVGSVSIPVLPPSPCSSTTSQSLRSPSHSPPVHKLYSISTHVAEPFAAATATSEMDYNVDLLDVPDSFDDMPTPSPCPDASSYFKSLKQAGRQALATCPVPTHPILDECSSPMPSLPSRGFPKALHPILSPEITTSPLMNSVIYQQNVGSQS